MVFDGLRAFLEGLSMALQWRLASSICSLAPLVACLIVFVGSFRTRNGDLEVSHEYEEVVAPAAAVDCAIEDSREGMNAGGICVVDA